MTNDFFSVAGLIQLVQYKSNTGPRLIIISQAIVNSNQVAVN